MLNGLFWWVTKRTVSPEKLPMLTLVHRTKRAVVYIHEFVSNMDECLAVLDVDHAPQVIKDLEMYVDRERHEGSGWRRDHENALRLARDDKIPEWLIWLATRRIFL